MRALGIRKQLRVIGVTEDAQIVFQVGQADLGGGVFWQQIAGGGELDGFDLRLGRFEGGV